MLFISILYFSLVYVALIATSENIRESYSRDDVLHFDDSANSNADILKIIGEFRARNEKLNCKIIVQHLNDYLSTRTEYNRRVKRCTDMLGSRKKLAQLPAGQKKRSKQRKPKRSGLREKSSRNETSTAETNQKIPSIQTQIHQNDSDNVSPTTPAFGEFNDSTIRFTTSSFLSTVNTAAPPTTTTPNLRNSSVLVTQRSDERIPQNSPSTIHKESVAIFQINETGLSNHSVTENRENWHEIADGSAVSNITVENVRKLKSDKKKANKKNDAERAKGPSTLALIKKIMRGDDEMGSSANQRNRTSFAGDSRPNANNETREAFLLFRSVVDGAEKRLNESVHFVRASKENQTLSPHVAFGDLQTNRSLDDLFSAVSNESTTNEDGKLFIVSNRTWLASPKQPYFTNESKRNDTILNYDDLAAPIKYGISARSSPDFSAWKQNSIGNKEYAGLATRNSDYSVPRELSENRNLRNETIDGRALSAIDNSSSKSTAMVFMVNTPFQNLSSTHRTDNVRLHTVDSKENIIRETTTSAAGTSALLTAPLFSQTSTPATIKSTSNANSEFDEPASLPKKNSATGDFNNYALAENAKTEESKTAPAIVSSQNLQSGNATDGIRLEETDSVENIIRGTTSPPFFARFSTPLLSQSLMPVTARTYSNMIFKFHKSVSLLMKKSEATTKGFTSTAVQKSRLRHNKRTTDFTSVNTPFENLPLDMATSINHPKEKIETTTTTTTTSSVTGHAASLRSLFTQPSTLVTDSIVSNTISQPVESSFSTKLTLTTEDLKSTLHDSSPGTAKNEFLYDKLNKTDGLRRPALTFLTPPSSVSDFTRESSSAKSELIKEKLNISMNSASSNVKKATATTPMLNNDSNPIDRFQNEKHFDVIKYEERNPNESKDVRTDVTSVPDHFDAITFDTASGRSCGTISKATRINRVDVLVKSDFDRTTASTEFAFDGVGVNAEKFVSRTESEMNSDSETASSFQNTINALSNGISVPAATVSETEVTKVQTYIFTTPNISREFGSRSKSPAEGPTTTSRFTDGEKIAIEKTKTNSRTKEAIERNSGQFNELFSIDAEITNLKRTTEQNITVYSPKENGSLNTTHDSIESSTLSLPDSKPSIKMDDTLQLFKSADSATADVRGSNRGELKELENRPENAFTLMAQYYTPPVQSIEPKEFVEVDETTTRTNSNVLTLHTPENISEPITEPTTFESILAPSDRDFENGDQKSQTEFVAPGKSSIGKLDRHVDFESLTTVSYFVHDVSEIQFQNQTKAIFSDEKSVIPIFMTLNPAEGKEATTPSLKPNTTSIQFITQHVAARIQSNSSSQNTSSSGIFPFIDQSNKTFDSNLEKPGNDRPSSVDDNNYPHTLIPTLKKTSHQENEQVDSKIYSTSEPSIEEQYKTPTTSSKQYTSIVRPSLSDTATLHFSNSSFKNPKNVRDDTLTINKNQSHVKQHKKSRLPPLNPNDNWKRVENDEYYPLHDLILNENLFGTKDSEIQITTDENLETENLYSYYSAIELLESGDNQTIFSVATQDPNAVQHETADPIYSHNKVNVSEIRNLVFQVVENDHKRFQNNENKNQSNLGKNFEFTSENNPEISGRNQQKWLEETQHVNIASLLDESVDFENASIDGFQNRTVIANSVSNTTFNICENVEKSIQGVPHNESVQLLNLISPIIMQHFESNKWQRLNNSSDNESLPIGCNNIFVIGDSGVEVLKNILQSLKPKLSPGQNTSNYIGSAEIPEWLTNGRSSANFKESGKLKISPRQNSVDLTQPNQMPPRPNDFVSQSERLEGHARSGEGIQDVLIDPTEEFFKSQFPFVDPHTLRNFVNVYKRYNKKGAISKSSSRNRFIDEDEVEESGGKFTKRSTRNSNQSKPPPNDLIVNTLKEIFRLRKEVPAALISHSKNDLKS